MIIFSNILFYLIQVVPAKKSKSDSKESKSDSKQSKSDSKKSKGDGGGDENSWSLGKNRFIKLTEFKNTWYIDVREFYNADGDLKPGRKGIMLSMEQWQKVKGFMNEIDEAIKKNV